MKKIFAVIAPGFEEIEAVGVIDVMRRLGVQVVTAGLDGKRITGSHGMELTTDTTLDEVNVSAYDAVFLPGGATKIAESAAVINAVIRLHADRKIIAAICAAPLVLAKAGLLQGKTFTMYPGFEEKLGGLRPSGNLSERDGNVVTGRGPGAVFAFAAEFAGALGLGEECKELYKVMFVRL